jgi:hypothetical protein
VTDLPEEQKRLWDFSDTHSRQTIYQDGFYILLLFVASFDQAIPQQQFRYMEEFEFRYQRQFYGFVKPNSWR